MCPVPIRILYLILLSDDEVYWRDMKAQQDTWAKEDVSVIWISGWYRNYMELKDRILYLPIADSYKNILAKTLMGMEWCLNNLAFDFMVRTNTSTYFNIDKNLQFLMTFQKMEYFSGGYIEKCYDKYFGNSEELEFISGCGIFLSRACVSEIMSMNPILYIDVPEDIAISHFLHVRNLEVFRIARNNIHMTNFYLSATHARLKSAEDANLASKRMYRVSKIVEATTLKDRILASLEFHCAEFNSFTFTVNNLITYAVNVRYIILNYLKTKFQFRYSFLKN